MRPLSTPWMLRVSKMVLVAAVAAAVAATAYLVWNGSRGPVSGSLIEVSKDAYGEYETAGFVISLARQNEEPSSTTLRIEDRRVKPGRVLWESVAGKAFVSAARGEETVSHSRGHFFVEDKILSRCPHQTIERVEKREDALLLRGRLLCEGLTTGPEYKLSFSPAADGRLRFMVEVEEPLNRLYFTYASNVRERFLGFGAQYTYLDMKGRKVPVFIREQGIGRGAQPITFGANLRAKAGGDWYTTYASVPHYITSDLRSLFLENYEYSAFDLRDEERVQIEVFSSRMTGQILSGRTPAELIEQYTEYSGRQKPLPDWLLSGAVIGLQGGTGEVLDIYRDLAALDTPVAALWLQDWVGRRRTSFGSQLWWNWELDRDLYPDWESLLRQLEADGVRVMTYVNPLLADPSEKPNHRRNLFAEAREKGYLVEKPGGGPYMTRGNGLLRGTHRPHEPGG